MRSRAERGLMVPYLRRGYALLDAVRGISARARPVQQSVRDRGPTNSETPEAQMPYSALSRYRGARFPEGMTDVRGFEVRTREDEKVGKVEDLIATADGRVRYL